MRGSRNLALGLMLAGIFAGMVALSYAAVPLYRVFCQATGYGGTTQRASAAPTTISAQTMSVRFDAEVNPGLPWRFFPEQKQVNVHLGEPTLVYFRAENYSTKTITGTATFNVLPVEAGQYFDKIQCFCFTQQTLKPGESVDMAVQFFVDPALLKDADVKGIGSITLSYSFFRADDAKAPPVDASLEAPRTPPALPSTTAN
jgi:cytochrome c oxidase assembly protein subunit 11